MKRYSPSGPVFILSCLMLLMQGAATGYCAASQVESTESGLAGYGSDFGASYWKSYLSDTGRIILSPRGWDRSSWFEAAGLTGLAAGLYALDPSIRSEAQEIRGDATDDAAGSVRLLGDGKFVLPPLGALYLYGYISSDVKACQTVRLGLESFVLSGTFTALIKSTCHRARPSESGSARQWDGPGLSNRQLSFPSGHSTVAFALATTIATQYGNHWFVPPLCFSMASLTALSRINDNQHWASDVFVGSAVGYFTARAIARFHGTGDKDKISLYPSLGRDGAGLMLQSRF